MPVDARDVRLRIDPQPSDGGCGKRGVRRSRAAEQSAHAGAKLLRAKGFFEIVVGAEVEQLRPLVRAALAREHKDWCRRDRPDPLTDLVAGKPRQPAIEDHEVRRFLSVPPQGSLTVVCGDDLVALVTEKRRDHSDERALVVHDEDAGQRDAVSAGARARGKVNANMAPPSGASPAQMAPPCPSTTRRDAKSPMPEPGTSSMPTPRALGSKIRARSFGGTPRP